MALITACGRLSSKSVLATIGRFPAAMSSAQYAQHTVPSITIKKYEAPKSEYYEVKNTQLKRPLSPHMTIYSFPMPAVLSITHRASGIILSTYASAFGIGALCLPNDISYYMSIVESLNLSAATIFVAKALIASPLSYHLANGIRHLYWDTAKGLTMKEVYATGYAVLAATLVITIFLASL